MNNSTASHPGAIACISTGILALSVLLAVAVIALVLYLRLLNVLVYRLGLYQFLSAMLFGIADGVYLWLNTENKIRFATFLWSVGVLKVMLNMWVVVHLFALAVLHKNMRKWEIIYLVSSISVALLFFCFLIIGVYAKDSYLFCHIVYIVMTAVASVLFIGSIVLAIAMIVTLCWRACFNKKLSQLDQQHKKALYQMMPLLAYPILFLAVTVPAIANVYYDGNCRWLTDVNQISVSLWSVLSPFLFTIHVCVMLCTRRKKPTLFTPYTQSEGCGSTTVNEARPHLRSSTYFTFPEEG